jgi:hypothetical protein
MSTDLSRAVWRKSARSSAEGSCVELAGFPSAVAVRDSKDPAGPAFVFGRPAVAELLDRVKAGKLDL